MNLKSFSGAIRQAAFLMILAALPAVAAAFLHPSRPDPARIPMVDASTVKAWSYPFLWVDARPRAEFLRDGIPGAISLSEEEWERSIDAFLDAWDERNPVVVYCGGGDCGTSESVARRLRKEAAIKEIYVLKGGVSSWRKMP